MAENYLLSLYRRCLKLPAGQWLFSNVFARKAPYFKTIRPRIVELRENYCRLQINKRRAVENHIGTVHAIAVCNGMEMAMGAVAEASIPAHLRWIPMGMNVRYLAKSNSDITVEASANPAIWSVGEHPIQVSAKRTDGTEVAVGEIIIYISEKKK